MEYEYESEPLQGELASFLNSSVLSIPGAGLIMDLNRYLFQIYLSDGVPESPEDFDCDHYTRHLYRLTGLNSYKTYHRVLVRWRSNMDTAEQWLTGRRENTFDNIHYPNLYNINQIVAMALGYTVFWVLRRDVSDCYLELLRHPMTGLVCTPAVDFMERMDLEDYRGMMIQFSAGLNNRTHFESLYTDFEELKYVNQLLTSCVIPWYRDKIISELLQIPESQQ